MTKRSPTRAIHELNLKINFLKTNDLARKKCRHDGTMSSFARELGISENTLNDCIRLSRLRLNPKQEDLISEKCGFKKSWPQWHDAEDNREPNRKPYDPPRRDTAAAFEQEYISFWKAASNPSTNQNARSTSCSFSGTDEVEVIELNIDYEDLDRKIVSQTFFLDYGPIIRTNMERYVCIKQDFELILAQQIRAHRSLLRYDYETTPCPLPGGMTVFLSKLGNRLRLEWLAKPQFDVSLDEKWEVLCKTYFDTTRLRYRNDHELLLKKVARQEALDIMARLLTYANKYFLEVVRLDPRRADPEILMRKRGAEQCLARADAYADALSADGQDMQKSLGNLVISLDMTLSNIHKLIIAFAERERA